MLGAKKLCTSCSTFTEIVPLLAQADNPVGLGEKMNINERFKTELPLHAKESAAMHFSGEML